jgi:ADP-ribose pyrophosphatase YjhB (NUDIX family)
MINCILENKKRSSLRHVVTHSIVEKNGKILLVKRAKDLLEGGKWALPGGFLDREETASSGALRELLEETGWQGEILALFRINSNPQRPREDRQNVALEFIVKPIKKQKAYNDESSEVKWVLLKEIDSLDFAFDHKETINLYLQYRQIPFKLPLLV